MRQLLLEALLFGILGLLVEDVFTGIRSFFQGDRRGTTKSYLYMPLVWGVGGLLFRLLEPGVAAVPFWAGRILLWMLLIYVMEALSGTLLKKVLGVVPWDYSAQEGSALGGTINIWYSPFWAGLAILVHPTLHFVAWVATRLLQ